jgi:DNA transformation protein
MAVSKEFQDFIEEILAPMGGISIKRMFGGAGVFLDGMMFALIDDDQLYFKADAGNAPQFDEAGLDYFTYQAKGKEPMKMGYRATPETALDDQEEMLIWARRGFEAALRAVKSKPKRKKKTTSR